VALDADSDIVVVHDAARPLMSLARLEKAIALMKKESALVTAVPVKSTIKEVDAKGLCIQKTLKRDRLWEIQTPQLFRKDVLLKAHQRRLCLDPTDDAMLVEAMGVQVRIFRGEYENMKVTTPDDLIAAQAFLRARKNSVKRHAAV
jgi:2-C-methyl-D-erythritol 4-phosphate cytidylyltransferase